VSHLTDEVDAVIGRLRIADRKLVKPDLAYKVVEAVLGIQEPDSGCAIRYTLSGLHIGNQGQKNSRQAVFRAYWRLARKTLDDRERKLRLARRRKEVRL